MPNQAMPDLDARTNGWTGGQWSLVRAAIAVLLLWTGCMGLVGFSITYAHDEASRRAIDGFEWAGLVAPHYARIALALVFGLGIRDRAAAACIAATVVLGAWGGGSIERELAGSWMGLAELGIPWMLPFAALWLMAPPAPFGSWDARGRVDPGGAWRRAARHMELGWMLFALACLARAVTWLVEPAWQPERLLAIGLLLPSIGFLAPGLRSLGWSIAVAVTLAHVALRLDSSLDPIDPFPWLRIVLALVAFDPAWIAPRASAAPDHVFYDGACGLCHRTLRFLIAEQRDASAFLYSPLAGTTIAALLPPSAREHLPDSLVVSTADGRVLVRSRAVLYLLERLGGLWRLLAMAARVVPRPLADVGYDVIASARKRLFRRPADACPLLPPEHRTRFLP